MRTLKPRHNLTLSIWFGYVFFVAYGSLVPLDFKPLPLDQAWVIFQHIQMYKLGVESRADWIANGVLYVPVGFLTAHLLIQKFSDARRAPLSLIAGLFSVALAFSVEFTQIFFPPRTVSLNDLLAESIGSLIGLMLAARYSDWFKTVLQTMFSKPGRLTSHLLEAYFAGYVAFSLFPYDILLSGAELEQKLAGNSWGWLIAGDLDGEILIALKSTAEIVLTLPFGIFLGHRSLRHPATYRTATLWGTLLGGLIEIAQLFTASGVTQGLSVLTRIAGFCIGLALWNGRAGWSPERVAALIQRYAPPLGAIYLLALLQANGYFSHLWNGTDFAVSRLGELHFLPFYYHYYTTEAKALFSLASVCLMYLPIGLLTWSNRGSPSSAFFYALFAASLIETGKLFLQGMHPDPTNIMLGALASWGTLYLARELSRAANMPATTNMAVSPAPQFQQNSAPDKHAPHAGESAGGWAIYAVLLPSLAVVVYRAATFPTQPVLLCVFLAACAAIVWRKPAMLVAIIPAALPLLDLASWSGRFFLDEFDLLLLTSLAIGYTRTSPAPREKLHSDTLFTLASSLLALSFTISAMRGLIPWPAPDANAFTNYYSPFNAIRIAKGALWAFLLYWFFARLIATGHNVPRLFAHGMLAGIAGTVLVIFWERFAFPGLLNFSDIYRVTGPFSQMNTGGADIETYLTIGAPFLVMLVIDNASSWTKMACALLLLGATFGVMVTFSRIGYAGYGLAFALSALVSIAKPLSDRSGGLLKRATLGIILSAAVLGIATPIFFSQFAQERMSLVGADLHTRRAHWDDALKMRDPGWAASLLGMGLGRYPETHFWRSEEARAAPYWLGSEAENTFLKLGTGSPMYVEQFVSVQAGKEYTLELQARSNLPNAQLTLSLCEKWLLTSAQCTSTPVSFIGNGSWQTVQVRLATSDFREQAWYARRPVKFSLYNTSLTGAVDVDNIRLSSAGDQSLLENGDFSQKFDHWFFTVDNDRPWHIWSLPIQILFDQGWLGVLAFGLLVPLGLYRAGQQAWRGNAVAGSCMAAGIGVMVIGTLDSLIDSPRMLLLFLLVIWLCSNSTRLPPPARGQSSSAPK